MNSFYLGDFINEETAAQQFFQPLLHCLLTKAYEQSKDLLVVEIVTFLGVGRFNVPRDLMATEIEHIISFQKDQMLTVSSIEAFLHNICQSSLVNKSESSADIRIVYYCCPIKVS